MTIWRFIRPVVLSLTLLSSTIMPLAAGEPMIVFAAASLKTALDDILQAWQQAGHGVVTVSYAGSSALAQQIHYGAPADVFISANVEWMDFLAEKNLIRRDSRRNLLSNTLVLIAHGKNAAPLDIHPGFDLRTRLKGGRLVMAMVDAVPAGMYGKAALQSLDVWNAVAPHVAQTDNVRAALTLVARGEAPLGIVYATDAAADDNVTIVGTFPATSHPPIVYPAALTAHSSHHDAAAFLHHLFSPTAAAVFEKHGFRVLKK